MPEELTTADLAQSKRPSASEARPKPFLAEPGRAELAENAAPDVGDAANAVSLFPDDEIAELRNRWNGVQTAFVDEPRRAVEEADGLVAAAMKRLAEVFADERSNLEKQWDRGDNVSTEDLRIALQRYRAFFHRLLSI
ncbi:MAG: hypothetical protein WB562_17990 [Candidatus Sulfotelmatobacter sp.]